MKRDAIIAIAAVVLVAGIAFGLSLMKLDLGFTPSRPYTTAAVGETVSGHVIMRVNGEPITQEEFEASYAQLPEETQRQLSSPQGKSAFAEQLVRYKILEQEARKMGLDRDPKVSAMVAADRTGILASAAAQKLVGKPTDEAVRNFYSGHRDAFDSIELSHIVVAYQGGIVPPRPGNVAPPEREAAQKAQEIAKQIHAGADFARLALQVSDDVATAERGGAIGMVAHGQLPPELEQRVFAMKEGEISGPIPSRFGVHIFRAGRRLTQPIDQVRPAITAQVQRQNTLDRIESLRKTAKVDFDPKFFPEAQPKTPKKTS